jgi:hypothetical protein
MCRGLARSLQVSLQHLGNIRREQILYIGVHFHHDSCYPRLRA